MKAPHVFAIASCNHLAEMRVLMASAAEHWPEAKRVVFLVDSPEGRFDPTKEDFEIIPASDTDFRRFRQMAFAYTAAELCFALKSFCARYLVEKRKADAVVYFDGDMLLLDKPVDLIEALQKHPIVLTPQRLRSDDPISMHYFNVMHGPFNGGFFAVTDQPEARAFLEWWGKQMAEPTNVSVHWQFDQGWLSFVPVLFPHSLILRHPGYNVAFWNLIEREVRQEAAWESGKVEKSEGGESKVEGCEGGKVASPMCADENSGRAPVVSRQLRQGHEALGERQGAGGMRRDAAWEGGKVEKFEGGQGTEWRVRFGGEEYPLVLYHFSLFDMNRPDSFTGTVDSGCGAPVAAMKILLRDYAAKLAAAGHAECHAWPYGFGAFADGEPVTPGHREYFKQRFFRRIGPDADPFDPRAKLPGGEGLKSLRNFGHPVSRLVRRIKSMARGILAAD